MPLIVSLSDIEFSQDFDASSAYGASIAFGASIACFACLLFTFCQRVILNSNKEVQEVRAPIRWRISNLLISCRRFIFNRQVIMLAGFVLLANYASSHSSVCSNTEWTFRSRQFCWVLCQSFGACLPPGCGIESSLGKGSLPSGWRVTEEQKRSKNIFEILMDWTRISVLFVGLCFVVESQSTALLVEFVELSTMTQSMIWLLAVH